MFHVVRVQFFRAFFHKELYGRPFYIFNFVMSLPSVILSIWFPNVGSLLGICGSYLGIFTIYLLPIALHLRRTYLEIYNPILLKMLEKKLIISYDEVDDATMYYDYKKENVVEAVPQNTTLQESLIQNDDTFEISQTVHMKKERKFRIDPNPDCSNGRVPVELRDQVFREILDEYKHECEYRLRPTGFTLVSGFVVDMVALTYGLIILIIQFIQF